MWTIKFKLKDPEDIYSPLCVKHQVEFFASTYAAFVENDSIHVPAGGILFGTKLNIKKFVTDLKKDKRVWQIERNHDFIFVHAIWPTSRERRLEIKIFYNPKYIRFKPIHVSSDGWEYWQVSCHDQQELKKLSEVAKKYYRGQVFSFREESPKDIAKSPIYPELTAKQLEAIRLAHKEGYYDYPHGLTIQQLAKQANKSYATLQEHLRKAESKIIEYFLLYRS